MTITFTRKILEKKNINFQGCEWLIMKKEENSRVAFRAVRFALKMALF